MDLKGVIKVLDNIANSPAKAEAQAFLLDLQTENHKLRSENIDLKTQLYDQKKRIDEYFEWDKAKALYEPYKTKSDTIVYVHIHQGNMRELFCANCFANRKIIHLQPHLSRGYNTFCPNCKNEYKTFDADEPVIDK